MHKIKLRTVASYPTPSGFADIEVPPALVEACASDPAGVVARLLGITTEQYLRWVATVGTPQCGALTRRGKRCKQPVPGGIAMPLDVWLRMDGGLCVIHGADANL